MKNGCPATALRTETSIIYSILFFSIIFYKLLRDDLFFYTLYDALLYDYLNSQFHFLFLPYIVSE